MNDLNLFNQERTTLKGVMAEFDGIEVLFVHQGGKTVGVGYESIALALGGVVPTHLVGFVSGCVRPAWIEVDGSPQRLKLLPLKEFFQFCESHPSTKLNSFRDRLAQIAVSVQQTGGYIAPGAGWRAYLPPGMEDDDQSVVLAQLQANRAESVRLAKEVEQVKGEVRDIQRAMGRSREHITLSNWLEYHGVKNLTLGEMTSEGQKLLKACQAMGVSVPDKVIGDGNHLVRPWPRVAYETWWPDFCRRRQIALTWKA